MHVPGSETERTTCVFEIHAASSEESTIAIGSRSAPVTPPSRSLGKRAKGGGDEACAKSSQKNHRRHSGACGKRSADSPNRP